MNDNTHAKIVLPATLEIERVLPTSMESAWEYLVDPSLRQQWFCAGETGSQAGEPFVMDFDHSRISESEAPDDGCGDPQLVVGSIVTFDPPNLLCYDWPGSDEDSTTRVTIRLKQQGEGTHLHLVHERIGTVEFQRGASAGWHAHLDLLVDLVGGAKPRDFWPHYISLKKHYDESIAS